MLLMLKKLLLNAMLARRLCLLTCLLMPLQFLAAQQYDFFAGFEDPNILKRCLNLLILKLKRTIQFYTINFIMMNV